MTNRERYAASIATRQQRMRAIFGVLLAPDTPYLREQAIKIRSIDRRLASVLKQLAQHIERNIPLPE